ncbi:hypothetical protein ACTA71_001661 [Dictyostelium dimigraforme]
MEKLLVALFFVLIFSNLTISTIPDGELVCAENLATKYNINELFPNNNYCGNSSIILCTTSVIRLSINFLGIVSPILTEDDLSCFPNLEELVIKNLQITEGLLNYNFTKGTKITFQNPYCLNCNFTKKLGNYQYFLLSSFQNLIVNIGFICHIGEVAFTSGSGFYLQGPTELTQCSSNRMILYGINFPDLSKLSNVSSINFNMVGAFDKNSISNFSTLSAKSVGVYHSEKVPFYFDQNYKISEISIQAPFDHQSSIISFINNINYNLISITSSNSLNFSVNGEIPIIVNNNVTFQFSQGNLTKIPSLANYGDYNHPVTLSNNKLNGPLSIYDGRGINYIFDTNDITGTIDQSWCNTILSIKNNKLNGKIPTCYQCYFNYTGNSNIPNIYNGFTGNQFTNLNKSLPCTTFKPKIKTINSTTLNVYGDDIGFDPNLWWFNGTIPMNSNYQINKFGYDYTCNIGSNIGLDYFSILFTIPHQTLYTFSVTHKPVFVSNLKISKDGSYIFYGLYFSSYIGYQNQTIEIGGLQCNQSSTTFFNTKCVPSEPINTDTTKLNYVTIDVDQFQTKYYINSSLETNNMPCSSCSGYLDTCDLTSGRCVCQNGRFYFGCLCSNYNFDITCYQPNPFISSVSPSNTSGGIATIFGSFGSFYNSYSILLNGFICSNVSFSNSEISFIAPPGNGIQTLTLTINGVSINEVYRYEDNVVICPGNPQCSGNGICNSNGACKCNSGWTSFDCSIIFNNGGGNNNNNNGGNEIPPTNSTIDGNTGGTNITNQEVNFQIYFKTLKEINYQGSIVNEYPLKNNWNLNTTFSPTNLTNQFIFDQAINENKTRIISIIEEVTDQNGKEYDFAGTSFKLSQGSIKFTISIHNYSFQSNLNTLQLDLISIVDQSTNTNNDDNQCNSKSVEIDTSNANDLSTFNYIKISKNNKILEGRFVNKMVSDGRPTFFSTTITNNSDSITVSLNLPHCQSECIIDPDFSLLVSPDFKSDCNKDNSNRKWLIPVVVVVSVVSIASIIAISIILYKKSVISKDPIFKLLKLSKKNNNYQ